MLPRPPRVTKAIWHQGPPRRTPDTSFASPGTPCTLNIYALRAIFPVFPFTNTHHGIPCAACNRPIASGETYYLHADARAETPCLCEHCARSLALHFDLEPPPPPLHPGPLRMHPEKTA